MSRSVFCCRTLPFSLLCLVLAGVPAVRPILANAAPAETAAPQGQAPQGQAPQGQAPQAAATQLFVAQGTVRDSAGQPVKGATISILDVTEDGGALPQTSAQTDADGHFQVEAGLSSEFFNEMRRGLGMGEKEFRAIAMIHAPGLAVAQIMLNGAGAKGGNLPTNDITLMPGFGTTGRIVDGAGKPLAGVKVGAQSVQLAGKDRDSFDSVVWLQGLPQDSLVVKAFQEVSDATGHFTLHDLPLGTVTVTPVDPRFVGPGVQLTISNTPTGADKAVALTVQPALNVRGRVLYPDGKPAAGATITTSGTSVVARGLPATAKTRPDGTYEIGGLMAGDITLGVTPPSPEWAPSALPPLQLKAGKNQADDITLTHGVLLTGYVREDRTQVPVAGVKVRASVTSSTAASTPSDAQGRYQIRLPLGEARFWISTVPIEFSQSYGSSPQMSVGTQSKNAPNFLLQRAVVLTGTAKDEKGQPAVGATISNGNSGPNVSAIVDAQGNWTLRPQIGNNTQVKLQIGGDWALRGNATVNLPSPPLALTLYHITLADVKVRVVTPSAQPIAGATVHYRMIADEQNSRMTTGDFTSDAQGEIILPKLRPEQSAALTASKTGYSLVKAGKVTRLTDAKGLPNTGAPEGLARGSDIVMTPLDAQVSGRVLDAEGRPASGARVALLAPNNLRDLPETSTLTDAQGRFTLGNLPQGDVTLGVAKGRAFGQSTAQANAAAGKDVELKLGTEDPLPMPQDTESAFATLERWAKEAQDKGGVLQGRDSYDLSSVALKLVPYDADRALRAMTGAEGKVNQSFVIGAIPRLGRSNPQGALAWGQKALPLIEDAKQREATKLDLAILLARTNPEWARQTYEIAAAGTTPTDLSLPAAQRYAQLAALAGALKNPDADGWLQALTLCLTTIPADAREQNGGGIATTLAKGDLAGARKWVAQLDLQTQVQMLAGFAEWAADNDLPTAQQVLGDMEVLVKRPDFPVPPVRTDGRYQPSAYDTLNTTRQKILHALMKTDIKAAQQMAQKLRDNLGVGILSDATQLSLAQVGPNDRETVQAALAAARNNWEHPAGDMAFIGALVSEKLPQLSAQAFKEARDKLAHPTDNGRSGEGETAAFYAYARASFDPAESRLLVENDWLRTMSALKEAQDGNGGGNNTWELASRLIDLARVMTLLSPTRMDEMIRELVKTNTDASYYVGQARSFTITWLLSDATARRIKPLGNAYETQDD